MRACWLLLVCIGCDDGPSEPVVVPLVGPGLVTITEGRSTSFTLGLTSLARGDAHGEVLPQVAGHVMTSTPDFFSLNAATPSAVITVAANRSPDATNANGTVDFYHPGAIAGESPTAGLMVVDTDALNFDASNWNLSLSRSETSTFSIRLTQPPAAPVSATLSVEGVLVATPSTLTFSPSDYATPHVVTVTAPDLAFDNLQITIADDAGAIPSQRVNVEATYAARP